ncbi:MAG: TetR/AcrR family transcriptional regulator [Dehalococcoidia bacterium]|nr:TetR/AcrR family transcriptional regulator [Dehalococcoidia bacterium]
MDSMIKKPKNQRTNIIDESIKLFLWKGYHATSMDDISASVGLKKGSIYHYFTGKEAILRQCVLMPLQSALSLIKEVVEKESSPVEKLRQAIQIQIQIVHDHPELFIAVQENFDLFEPELRDEVLRLQTEYEKLFQTVVTKGIESGEFRADLSPRIVSYGILGMCNWMFRWYRKDGVLTSSQIADQFFSLLAGGILCNPQLSSPRDIMKRGFTDRGDPTAP